jgi:hypothetical protein
MFRKVRSQLSFSNVVAMIALFIALGGTSYAVATGSIDSREIKNNTIRSKDVRTGNVASSDLKNDDVRTQDLEDDDVGTEDLKDGDIRNADTNGELALAKGFASIAATNANGPATVLSFGGQQTSTAATGVTAQRVGTGIYDVTFTANDGKFTDVDSVDDLTVGVTGRNGFSTGSIFSNASTATADQVKLRVFMRRPDNGATIDAAFSLQFYARTAP